MVTLDGTKERIQALRGKATMRLSPCATGSVYWHVWGQGKPLLLLHGGSGSWTHWLRNIESLSTHYQVFVPDLPGTGDSGEPARDVDRADLLASVRMLAKELYAGWVQILADLGNPDYRIVGFSLGSMVGTAMAQLDAKHVEQLVLVGASGLGVRFGPLKGQLRTINEDTSINNQLDDQRHNLGLIMLEDKKSVSPGAAWIQLMNVKRARIQSHWLANSDVMVTALPEVRCRVTAIWGTRDVYAQPDLEHRLSIVRSLQPTVDIHLIHGAGHWVMYERANEFNDLALRVLENRQ